MSTTQAIIHTTIRRAATTKAKTKSPNAMRMARLRRQKKELAEMAEQLRTQFYNAACLKLAQETPKGSTRKSREFINAAWFQAGRLPPKAARGLARCFN